MGHPILNQNAKLHCDHAGEVQKVPMHPWMRIDGAPVLVKPDVEGKPISACPNTVPGTTVLCSLTLPIQAQTESQWIRVGGHAVTLGTIWGYTVCQPALSATYTVTSTGQSFFVETS